MDDFDEQSLLNLIVEVDQKPWYQIYKKQQI
jgi:hypothetical protein